MEFSGLLVSGWFAVLAKGSRLARLARQEPAHQHLVSMREGLENATLTLLPGAALVEVMIAIAAAMLETA